MVEFLKRSYKIKCPCCNLRKNYNFSWQFSGFDKSIFNYKALYKLCSNCGHLYISNIKENSLNYFYNSEQANYTQKKEFNKNLKSNIAKYKFYINQIPKNNNIVVCDLGCGNGGFLDFLKKSRPNLNLIGIDHLSAKFNTDKHINFIDGSSTKIPLNSDSVDCLTSFHTFEHVKNLNKTLREIKRVLKINGRLIIEVPNSYGYKSNEIVKGYWFTIREHIHHFNHKSLYELLKNDFKIIKVLKQNLESPYTSYPSLLVVAQKSDTINIQFKESKKGLQNFMGYLHAIDKSFREIDFKINNIENKTICFWGISNIAYSILPRLKKTQKKFFLFDKNINLSGEDINGIIVSQPKFRYNSTLICLVPNFFTQVKKEALKLGWKNSNILSISEFL